MISFVIGPPGAGMSLSKEGAMKMSKEDHLRSLLLLHYESLQYLYLVVEDFVSHRIGQEEFSQELLLRTFDCRFIANQIDALEGRFS